MKVGFTGTRAGMTDDQLRVVKKLLRDLDPVEFHHGDCIGADAQAHDLVKGLMPIHIHPPDEPSKRSFRWGVVPTVILHPEKPYMTRNRDIARDTDLLIACPKEYKMQLRSGTWATIRYAIKIGRQVIIVYPDGSTS